MIAGDGPGMLVRDVRNAAVRAVRIRGFGSTNGGTTMLSETEMRTVR